eukprot:gene11439-36018_t
MSCRLANFSGRSVSSRGDSPTATAAGVSVTNSAATPNPVRVLVSSAAALLLIFAAPDASLASGGASGPFTMDNAMSKYFELPPEESRLVSPTEASDLVTKGWQYLDVRTEEEFSHGHAPGAANIPFFLKGKEGFVPNPDFKSKLEASFPNKLVPIVVGCQSGARSTPATVMMLHEGYANLRNMEGGFPAWVKEGLPSVVEVIEDEGL